MQMSKAPRSRIHQNHNSAAEGYHYKHYTYHHHGVIAADGKSGKKKVPHSPADLILHKNSVC